MHLDEATCAADVARVVRILETRRATAKYQVAGVPGRRALAPGQVEALVMRASAGRQFGVLGEPRVNVLRLNLLLDGNDAPPEK